mmetsp:Transcript_32005/g.51913  ORF Transcript_32005/g.51913 Transcript_32005/m.51913 type:complete len:183 (+) Transcript_32005:1171-1719(+)
MTPNVIRDIFPGSAAALIPSAPPPRTALYTFARPTQLISRTPFTNVSRLFCFQALFRSRPILLAIPIIRKEEEEEEEEEEISNKTNIEAIISQVYGIVDSNSDGHWTLRELQDASKYSKGTFPTVDEKAFKALDADHNGAIELKEYTLSVLSAVQRLPLSQREEARKQMQAALENIAASVRT